ncbi:hypothetical protein DPMN_068546 [Dreissena polymorpha]|uniref:Uncharacterized protein n=1 Tax=Dreissena polymorpha TaxID=45954 RepID=A0A9D3Z1T7_DREPO|nr:hypothetical protein DPMN_068546 [Dreissena polymorpha]
MARVSHRLTKLGTMGRRPGGVLLLYSVVCNIRCMELSLLYGSVSVVCSSQQCVSMLYVISVVCISVVRISVVCCMLCVSVVISIVCISVVLMCTFSVFGISVVCSIFHDESIGSLREVEENKHHTDTKSQRE